MSSKLSKRRTVDAIYLLLLVLFAAVHIWSLFAVLLIGWGIVAFSRLFRRPAARLGTGNSLDEAISAGEFSHALARLDQLRAFAYDSDDVLELERVARLARLIESTATGRNQRRARDLAYAAEQNAKHVQRVLAERERRFAAAGPAPSLDRDLEARFGTIRTRFVDLSARVAAADPSDADFPRWLGWLGKELRLLGGDVVELGRDAEVQSRAAAAVALAAAAAPVKESVAAPEPVASRAPSLGYKEQLERIFARIESLGPRAFALVGGVVLLLGVALLLVFAAPRLFGGGGGSWFGPEVGLGFAGFASAVALLVGLRIRARYGNLYAASAAAGVGLAGFYATILAAAALYKFLPALEALGAATGVAAMGVVVSLWWSSELVAGLTLVGAMILPGVSLAEGHRSLLGALFVLLLAAGSGVSGVARRWSYVLVSGVGVSAAQMVVLVADSGPAEPGHWQRLALAGGFCCVYTATGIAFQQREVGLTLRREAAGVLLPGGALATWSAEHLLAGHARGAALLPLAGFYTILAAGVFARTRQRDLAILLAALGSVVAVLGFATLLTGTPLVISWAAQAPLLAWVARQTRDVRFRLGAFVYLGLALGRLLAVDSPPNHLFAAFHHPGLSAPGVLVLIAAALLVVLYLPSSGSSAIDVITARARLGILGLVALLGLYALSLTVLEVAQALGGAGVDANFRSGHVALAVVWSALAAVALASRRPRLEMGGLILLALTVVDVLAFDVGHLSGHQYAASLLAAAGASLAGALRTRRDLADGLALGLLSAGLATGALADVFSGDGRAYALLVEGVIYAAAAALLSAQKRRDLASLLGTLALGLGTAACALLLTGIALVATGGVAAVLLALLAFRRGEERLLAGSGAVLALVIGYGLVHEGPPRELFVAVRHPGLGAAALALGLPGLVLLARAGRIRIRAEVATAILGLYALSLAVLELAQDLGGGGVEANFGYGHVALALVWSALAAGALTARNSRLEVAGLGLLAVTVAEIAAFDIRELSVREAAAGLLAAGAAGLAGALSARREVPEALALTLVAAGTATSALAQLSSGDELAYSLLAEAVVCSLLLASTRRRRDLTSLLGALALGFGAAACAELISGLALVATGTGAAAVLAVLGRRDQRLLAGSAALLAASLGYALVGEAPPRHLFVATRHPGAGAAAIALCMMCAALLARGRFRPAATWIAATLALYALSLTVLELAQALGGRSLEANFRYGHVGLVVAWSAIALAAIAAASRLRSTQLEAAGAVLLALAGAVALGFDIHELSQREYAVSFLAIAAALLGAAYLSQRARPSGLGPEPLLGLVGAVAFGTAGVVLVASGDGRALALLGEGLVLGLVACRAFAWKLRDFGSIAGALGLAFGTAGCAQLVSGVSLVAAGTGVTVLLALTGQRAGERRVVVGAAGVLVLALGYALVHDAPPSALFTATRHPGLGAASIALCMIAAGMLARAARLQAFPARTESLWAAGILGLYSLSLAALEVAQALGTGSVHSRFLAGEAAVSGTWAAVALVFLYLGLAREQRIFQAVGFSLFGVSLGKIFLFDLANLTALTRALSFIAVGALLLTAGFFYQRLTQRIQETPDEASPSVG